MKQNITILVLAESSMMSLASIIDPLRAANRLSSSPLFSWQIVSFDGAPIELTCGIKIDVDATLEDAARTKNDVFAIIAGFNHQEQTPSNQLALLRKLANNSSTIFAIDAGSWLLARAGIIKSHNVTVHWEDIEDLSFAYPDLNVLGERYVIDQNIWTSGGASPSLDMFLHYLRSNGRVSLAVDVANVFIYNNDKHPSNAQTSSSLGHIEHHEPRLAKAIHLMEQQIEEPKNINEIAQHIGLSVRSLELIFKKYLALSPGTYYQRLRLQMARRLVLDTNDSVINISIKTGFSSQSALSRAFSKRYGKSPLQLREDQWKNPLKNR